MPVFVRVHNLLTSGDGKHALKWGSTNVYAEDADGNPVYDWTILDRIVDTYMAREMRPFVQLGFMPEALSSAPPGTPYRHFWKPGDPYNDIYTGMDVRAEGLQEVGRALLPGDAAPRREVRPPGSRELVVRALERARHRLLERFGWAERAAATIRWPRRRRRPGATSSTSSTTSPSRASAARCPPRGSAVRK